MKRTAYQTMERRRNIPASAAFRTGSRWRYVQIMLEAPEEVRRAIDRIFAEAAEAVGVPIPLIFCERTKSGRKGGGVSAARARIARLLTLQLVQIGKDGWLRLADELDPQLSARPISTNLIGEMLRLDHATVVVRRKQIRVEQNDGAD